MGWVDWAWEGAGLEMLTPPISYPLPGPDTPAWVHADLHLPQLISPYPPGPTHPPNDASVIILDRTHHPIMDRTGLPLESNKT